MFHVATSPDVMIDTLVQRLRNVENTIMIQVMSLTSSEWFVEGNKPKNATFSVLFAMPYERAALPVPCRHFGPSFDSMMLRAGGRMPH